MGWCMIHYVYCEKYYKLLNSSYKSYHTQVYLEFYCLSKQYPDPAFMSDWCHAWTMLYLDLHIHKLQSSRNCSIQQNVPRLPCAIPADAVPFFEYLWNHKLEQEEKQKNGCLALLGIYVLVLSKRKDLTSLLICVFSYRRAKAFLTLLKASPCCETGSICLSATHEPWWLWRQPAFVWRTQSTRWVVPYSVSAGASPVSVWERMVTSWWCVLAKWPRLHAFLNKGLAFVTRGLCATHVWSGGLWLVHEKRKVFKNFHCNVALPLHPSSFF